MVTDGKKRVNCCKMESWKNVKECKMLNDVKMLNWQPDMTCHKTHVPMWARYTFRPFPIHFDNEI